MSGPRWQYSDICVKTLVCIWRRAERIMNPSYLVRAAQKADNFGPHNKMQLPSLLYIFFTDFCKANTHMSFLWRWLWSQYIILWRICKLCWHSLLCWPLQLTQCQLLLVNSTIHITYHTWQTRLSLGHCVKYLWGHWLRHVTCHGIFSQQLCYIL